MKVKNIVFSGFAAAILMSAAHADPVFQIASKAYVDSIVGANGSVTQQIGNSDMGTEAQTITGAIAEIEGRVDDAESDIDDLEAALGDGFSSANTVADALDTKVDKSAVSTSIPSTGASNDKWASEKAVADAIADVTGGSGSVAEQIADALGDLGTNATTNEENTVEEALALKQNEADSNVANAGNYIAAGHGVAANLTALDTQLKATTDTANAAVPRQMNGTGGKALIFNENDGGGAKFENTDGTDSFTGVNDGGANGIAAQIYAVDRTSRNGARIDINQNGMYYTVGNAAPAQRMVEANKIATLGDITNAVGDSNSGLTGDVADLKETVGTGTLTGFGNGVDTVIEALNELQENKLNKPIPDTCTAQSQHCVLHRDQAGNLSWVDITVPYAE